MLAWNMPVRAAPPAVAPVSPPPRLSGTGPGRGPAWPAGARDAGSQAFRLGEGTRWPSVATRLAGGRRPAGAAGRPRAPGPCGRAGGTGGRGERHPRRGAAGLMSPRHLGWPPAVAAWVLGGRRRPGCFSAGFALGFFGPGPFLGCRFRSKKSVAKCEGPLWAFTLCALFFWTENGTPFPGPGAREPAATGEPVRSCVASLLRGCAPGPRGVGGEVSS